MVLQVAGPSAHGGPAATSGARRRGEGGLRQLCGGNPGTYGSTRVHAELRGQGRMVTRKTVAASMARQDLVAPLEPAVYGTRR